jgi:hypothetical protein
MTVTALLLATMVACGGRSSTAPPTPNNAGYSNASLNGSYVFNLRGINPNGGAFAAVGVLAADGNGNITSGQQDVNDAFSGVLQQVAISNGTYSVGVDGRGQATLNFANGAPSANFNFVLLSTSKARVVELSNFELSSGVLEKQVPAAINALTGPAYVLRMDGSSTNTLPISRAGLLTATGTGPSASVVVDENYNGTFVPTIAGSNVSFSFSPGGSGRGVLQFVTSQGGATSTGATINLVFYVVNSTHIELLSLNTSEQLSGYADVQSGTFTAANVSNPYVFSTSGYSATGYITETGSLTLNNAASSGLEDYVDTGRVFPSVSLSGTYAADSANNGHFTGNFVANGRTVNFVLWFSTPQNAELVAYNSTSSLIENGVVTVQPAVPTTSTVTGDYAFHLLGLTGGGNMVPTVLEGQVLADGLGTFTGLKDVNQGGSVSVGASASGSYSVASGRGTGTIGGIPVVLYPASSSIAYVMSTDGKRMLSGSLEAQH